MTGQSDGLPSVGETIAGKYRLERVLGEGGMGIVMAAEHLHLGQRVAIKFMDRQASADEGRVARFQREAWAAGKIQSDHVCRVSDVGRLDSGIAYMVMEYLEGEDLESLARRGALPLHLAIDYLLQAGEAMAEAHKHGIVHRDLKPGNLFLTRRADGSPWIKVLDFGISKITIGGSITKTSTLMGSPLYMAPEQLVSSKHVDPRSDIWSLGIILYELVSRRVPFDGDTLPAICTAVLHRPPVPLQSVLRSLPPAFAPIMDRWLQKDPELRYQNLAELAEALAPFGSENSRASVKFIVNVLSDAPATVMRPSPQTPEARAFFGSSPDATGSTVVTNPDAVLDVANAANPSAGTHVPATQAQAPHATQHSQASHNQGSISSATISDPSLAQSHVQAVTVNSSPSFEGQIQPQRMGSVTAEPVSHGHTGQKSGGSGAAAIAGIALAVVLALGAGGYFVFAGDDAPSQAGQSDPSESGASESAADDDSEAEAAGDGDASEREAVGAVATVEPVDDDDPKGEAGTGGEDSATPAPAQPKTFPQGTKPVLPKWQNKPRPYDPLRDR